MLGILNLAYSGRKGEQDSRPRKRKKATRLEKKNRRPVEAARLNPNEQEQSKFQSDNRRDIMEHKYSSEFCFVVSLILLHLFFLNTEPN